MQVFLQIVAFSLQIIGSGWPFLANGKESAQNTTWRPIMLQPSQLLELVVSRKSEQSGAYSYLKK